MHKSRIQETYQEHFEPSSPCTRDKINLITRQWLDDQTFTALGCSVTDIVHINIQVRHLLDITEPNESILHLYTDASSPVLTDLVVCLDTNSKPYLKRKN